MAVTACAADTLPNGLQLVRFDVRVSEPALVGSAVTVEFTLKNLSAQPMQFDPNVGIFIGARVNSTSDANGRDFGHANKGLVLAPGREVTLRASRPLDAAGAWRFWPAFRLNGQWGPFRWMEKTVQVFSSAADARPQSGGGPVAGTLTVAQVLANPPLYDGKRVAVVGDALIVRKQMDSSTGPWTLISLADIENSRMVMNVVGAGGHAPVSNGDVTRATGVFRVNSQRGRYTFKNELICDSGGIVKEERQTAQKQVDQQADGRPIINVNDVVGRQFNLALLRGRLAATGTELQVRFQTRTYSQTPRRNTILATGMGAAGIRVEKVEQTQRPTGPGSTPPGTGNAWLVLRLWLHGNASNAGMPDTFYQSWVNYDPGPVFFLVGRGGAVYWPDSSYSSAVTYSNRSDKTMGDIRMNAPGWTRSGLVFKVPQTLQDATLVVLTWQGGNRYEYAGVRLSY
ncbi:MAG: hypothetical protein ACHRHE_23995 [Tepidisphaerales bacterium]